MQCSFIAFHYFKKKDLLVPVCEGNMHLLKEPAAGSSNSVEYPTCLCKHFREIKCNFRFHFNLSEKFSSRFLILYYYSYIIFLFLKII